MTIRTLVLALMVTSMAPVFSQDSRPAEDQEAAYAQVITQRADKIVAVLGIADAAKTNRLRDIIAQQYRSLKEIHDVRDAQIKTVKEQAGDNKEAPGAGVKAARDEAKTKLDQLHANYLSKLSSELTAEQVAKVKDGMTYGVVQVTYNAYLKMLPGLTDEQKNQIMAWLVEAREIAMDAGSSEEKHQWFGKYKGKINNYLSAAGYDLKKAEKNPSTKQKAAADAKAQ